MNKCKQCEHRIYCEHGLMMLLDHQILELQTPCGEKIRLYREGEKDNNTRI